MARANQKTGFRRILFWSIAAVILLLIVTPFIMLACISDSRALVVEMATVNTSSAIKAKDTAKQLYKDLIDGRSNQEATLSLSENDINGIVALGARALPRLKGRVNVTPLRIMGAFTLDVPGNPLGRYLNLTGTVIPSSKGLVVESISLGSLDISGKLAMSLLESALNQLIAGDKFGTKLVNAIDSVEVDHSTLVLSYHPVPGLRDAIVSTKGQIKGFRDELELLGDPKVVKIYYEHLCGFHAQIDGLDQASAGYYLDAVFSHAGKRTLISGEPVEENQAALMALAIFLGSPRFNSVVGALDKETFATCPPGNSRTVLANREDLRLHFIFSAALKVIFDSSISYAGGEFKELLDTQGGGSGFSFADLAADRAGIRFAEVALDKTGARRLQKMSAQLRREEYFFPSIAELPEGIPKQVFDERGGIESDYYQQYLVMIDQRIEGLTLFQDQ